MHKPITQECSWEVDEQKSCKLLLYRCRSVSPRDHHAATAEGYSLQIQRLHAQTPVRYHKAPHQSVSDTSSPDAATDNEPKECQIGVLSLRQGQAGTVACSNDKHERLRVLVNLLGLGTRGSCPVPVRGKWSASECLWSGYHIVVRTLS